MNGFPQRRMRRRRRSAGMRNIARETHLAPEQLILPLFVVEDAAAAGEVQAMPGVERLTLDGLEPVAERAQAAGIQSVLLFGVPARKDALASSAAREDGIVVRGIQTLKRAASDLVVMTDVCLCSYTDHGHCGLVEGGVVRNDETLALLGRMSVAHAWAGADVVAPSGMMDGGVRAIREALDAARSVDTGILAYAVKYASAFYGPFREAADCAPSFGDRRTYQMDPANAGEALAEAGLDLDEGADMLMVKPALPYLDVVHRVKNAFPEVPLAAYQVSGEYSMIKAAAERSWVDERSAALESLTAIRRAGADLIITYWALQAAAWMA